MRVINTMDKERVFWQTVRRALLMVVRAIEKCFAIASDTDGE
jgi:hypothetical protein